MRNALKYSRNIEGKPDVEMVYTLYMPRAEQFWPSKYIGESHAAGR